MDEKQKEGILAFVRLYPLVPEQMAVAVEQISAAALLLKAYLHRYDLPRALYPICAQLAVAQTISAGIAETAKPRARNRSNPSPRGTRPSTLQAAQARQQRQQTAMPSP